MTVNRICTGRYACLGKEVQEYIYNNGPLPFVARDRRIHTHFAFGTGIVNNMFDLGVTQLCQTIIMRLREVLFSVTVLYSVNK